MIRLEKLLKLISIGIALCLMFTFVGCGVKTKPEGPSGGKSEKVSLNIWISTVNQPAYFMGWFEKAFEKANDNIDLNFIPSTNLGTGLDVSFADFGAPDMAATSGGIIVPILKAGNRVLNLESVIGDIKDTFYETALLNETDGELWCAPIFGFVSPVVYYNKMVFDVNNLTVPSSYAELVTLCSNIKKILDTNGNQKYQTIVTGYTYHILQAITGKTMTKEQLNAIIADKTDDAENPFDNTGMENALKWIETMKNDAIFANNLTGYTGTSAQSNFATQKSLMIVCPGIDLLDLSNSCTFEIGSFTLPSAPSEFSQKGIDGEKVAGIYNDCMVINSKTNYPDECKKVIEFMYSEEAQEELFNCFLYPVVKNTSYENVNSDIKELFNSSFKPIYDTVATKGMNIFWMNYFYKTGVDSTCEQVFKNIINGSYTVNMAWDILKRTW